MKKFILSILLVFSFLPISINASTTISARIGNNYYDSLEDAILNAKENDTIKLVSDVELNNSLTINKVVNIDLNGNDITAREKVFVVKDGFLDISGKGMIKETSPNYGAIMLIGSSQYTNEKYSSVKVGKDVTLEGWSGIFISHDSSKSYGVFAYLEGKINAVDDISGGAGTGIYVNGNIKDKNASPVINIMDGAKITSTGNGLYIAGSSTFNIGKAYIEGVESAIAIKAGKLNINGGTIICNGEDTTPTEGYNNGIKSSGATIQIESNNGYAGDIEIDISDGTFISKNSNVIYEYIGKGSNSLIYSMSISGGTFKSGEGKNVFSFSNSFKNIHSGFISGGEYSTDPSSYLKPGYGIINDEMYNVVKSSIKEVYFSNVQITKNKSFIKCVITLLIMMILLLIFYLKKAKKRV